MRGTPQGSQGNEFLAAHSQRRETFLPSPELWAPHLSDPAQPEVRGVCGLPSHCEGQV